MAVSAVCSRSWAGRGHLIFFLAFLLVLQAVSAGAAAADVLVTTSDTKLAGTLEEAHLSLEAVGNVFQLPLGFVSSLTRLEDGRFRLELINRDVLTGALRNRVLAFSTPSARMSVPADKVKSLVLQPRQAPPEAVDSLLVTLRNGDELAWMLSPSEQVVVVLETSFSDPVRLQLDKIREVRLGEGDRDVADMNNGDVLYGRLKDPLLRVRAYYQSVEIPLSEVAAIVFLSKAEAKARFIGTPAPAAQAPASPPVPPAAPALSAPAPPAAWSAARLSIDTAEPLADPRVADAYQPFSAYSFAPNGALAVAVGVPGVRGENVGREIWVYPGNGKRVVIGAPGEASSPAWSPDGGSLVYDFRPAGSSTSEVWVSAADGSSRRQLSRDGAGSHSSLAWSPDGKRLAYVTRDYKTGANGVWVFNLENSTAVSLLTSTSDYFSDLQWSPDGRKLLLVSGIPGANPRSTLKLIEVAGNVVSDLLPRSNKGVNEQPRWSPDGRAIAFVSDRSGRRQIWLVRPDGTDLRQLTADEEPKSFPVWSPDSAVVLYLAGPANSGNLWLVDAAGGESRRLSSSGRITGRTEWSPDGKRLVFTKREKALQLWIATLAVK